MIIATNEGISKNNTLTIYHFLVYYISFSSLKIEYILLYPGA